MGQQRLQHAIGQNTEGISLMAICGHGRQGSHGESWGVSNNLDGACCRPRSLAWVAIAATGTHLRRPASDRDSKRVHDVALMVHHAGAISTKACNYRSHWAQGTRRRLPRPAYEYVLETRYEEHPHLPWFQWIWKSNAMVFVLWCRMMIVSRGN